MAKLKVGIEITGIDYFNEIVKILKSVVDDNRIDINIREEYRERIINLTEKHRDYEALL